MGIRSMDTEIIGRNNKKDWDEFVYENPFTVAWHRYEWGDLLKRHHKNKFYPIVAYNGSKIWGILPLYQIKTFFEKDILISIPYVVAGGIASESHEAVRVLLAKAIELSKGYNGCNIIFKNYKVKMNGDLRTDDNYYNKELRLVNNYKGVWEEISDNNKEKIEESEKYNLQFEYPSENVNLFYRLLLRHSTNMGVPCVSKKWIEDLIALRMYSIALLKENSTVMAATMVKEFKKEISFPFTCIPDVSEKSNMFVYNLYWQLIKKHASEGKEIFHSGRIPKNDLTNKYRLGWGGVKYDYYYQYYPADVKKTEYFKKRGRKREIFELLWKKLPIGMARVLGRYVVKQFP